MVDLDMKKASERVSVNGKLQPKTKGMSITDEYLGHFLKVSYTQEVSGNKVYSKDRVDIEEDGSFRFFMPKAEATYEKAVTVEVYAPDGGMLGKQSYSFGSLNASNLGRDELDDTALFLLDVDPKVITFNESSPIVNTSRNISGRLVDISGEQAVSGLQVIIIAGNDPLAAADSKNYQPIFTAQTNKEGYFFGRVDNQDYGQAYALVAGLSEDPIGINLDDQKIPKNILLVTDLSALPEGIRSNNIGTPTLPDANQLVGNSSFSQDLGGKCVDFTVPNRTLEEYSFYQTVRTTEPEIRGFTITADRSKNLVNQYKEISAGLFEQIEQIQTSMSSLEIQGKSDHGTATLQQLHYELAAAFCGEEGAQPGKIFCETLNKPDSLNRETVKALLGHISQYISDSGASRKVFESLFEFVEDMKVMLRLRVVNATQLNTAQRQAENLTKSVDTQTDEGRGQEKLLGYLRSLITELANAEPGNAYDFKICLPKKAKTMGIMRMLQAFDETMDTLRNVLVLSLGDIDKIRENYDIYITSISTFINLLDRFYRFYKANLSTGFTLDNDYFVHNHQSIRAGLLKFKINTEQAISHIEAIKNAYISNHTGRAQLTAETSIDWDDTPTIYESTTIAHGHILQFKQQWKADGYSLGDLLYSLPLAPCQEKRVAILDWDRDEYGYRSEDQSVDESMLAEQSRNRDISEIVSGVNSENMHADSSNNTNSMSASVGFAFFGVGAGVSHSGSSSRSTANQNSSRNMVGRSLNSLQDNITQSAASLRTQRSTTIQVVGQNESVSAQTDIIKNNNHCHATTVEYFEVLKHYAIEQNLVDVQECLFVPLPMSLFDHKKVMRWKNTLRRSVYGAQVKRGFDAIERIADDYTNSDLPLGSYADEVIENFSGNLSISFELERPSLDIEAWKPEQVGDDVVETIKLGGYFPWTEDKWIYRYNKFDEHFTEAEKDAIFEAEYAPEIAREFIDTLEVRAVFGNGLSERLDLDFTLLSNYQRGRPLTVSIASNTGFNKGQTLYGQLKRNEIVYLRFESSMRVRSFSKIILRTVHLNYQTHHLNHALVRNNNVNNDLLHTRVDRNLNVKEDEIRYDKALLFTPLSAFEKSNPRKRDAADAQALIGFLNEHLEMSHKAIWYSMDSSRLFGLLDGYIAPNSNGKSVASVVDNKIMGIVGNNLVLKVVPGERLDPVFKRVEDLLAYYQPTASSDPYRISVPTKGVYAESVIGKCNSCEEIDNTRHWRFADVPCGTEATPIEALSMGSRHTETGGLQVKDFPASIINMQTTPTAADPTGLAAAISLLGKSDVFKDITGLEGTQRNAESALKTTSAAVTDIVQIAADLQKQEAMQSNIGSTLKVIEELEGKKQLTGADASSLRKDVMNTLVGNLSAATKAKESAKASKDSDATKPDGSTKPEFAKPTAKPGSSATKPAEPGASAENKKETE